MIIDLRGTGDRIRTVGLLYAISYLGGRNRRLAPSERPDIHLFSNFAYCSGVSFKNISALLAASEPHVRLHRKKMESGTYVRTGGRISRVAWCCDGMRRDESYVGAAAGASPFCGAGAAAGRYERCACFNEISSIGSPASARPRRGREVPNNRASVVPNQVSPRRLPQKVDVEPIDVWQRTTGVTPIGAGRNYLHRSSNSSQSKFPSCWVPPGLASEMRDRKPRPAALSSRAARRHASKSKSETAENGVSRNYVFRVAPLGELVGYWILKISTDVSG